MVGSDVHTVDLNRSGISRIAWFLMGIFFAVVGTIGIVIPGLPTTPLMILCLLYTSPSPRDKRQSRMPSSA